MKTQFLFIGSILLAGQGALSSTSPYYFGVSCASQGSMTAEALTASQEIRKYTQQIQNDPNCTNVATSLQSAFTDLEKHGLAFMQPENNQALKLSHMSQEVQALRSFSESDTSLSKDIVKLILNRSQKMASLVSKMTGNAKEEAAATAGATGDDGSSGSKSSTVFGQSIMTSSQKVAIAVHTGMNLLNGVIDQLPSSKECLKDPAATSQLLSGIVKTLSVFAGSGQTGMGSTFANTISKLGTVLRDSDFSDAYRKLNKQEFLSSLSCLLEVTEESYCSVRDNMSLLVNQEHATNGDETPEKDFNDQELRQFREGIFEGFYVLTQHIPNITEWIQKVQFGVEPKTPNDADFKDNILDEVNHYFKSLNRVEGELSKELENIRNAPDVNSQKVQALKLVLSLAHNVSSAANQNAVLGHTKQNFFENNVPSNLLVWFLLGMENVNPPDKCVTKADPAHNKPAMPINCEEWLKSYYREEPVFNSPLELIDTIKLQFKKLKQMANRTLISYYNRWFIVDRPNLVGESLTSATYSIPQSLEAIDVYLSHLTDRIHTLIPQVYGFCKENCPVSFKDSSNMIPIIQDTQRKIRAILAEYGKLEAKSQSDLPSVPDYEAMSPAQKKKAIENDIKFEKDYTNIIEEVYDRLMVMLARTGFLSNRLHTFVYHDISLVLKSNTHFSEYEKYFYFQTGKMILEKIKRMYGENLAAARGDMDMALRTHKKNIEVLEEVFKDNLLAMIAEAKMTAEGRPPYWYNMNLDSTQRLVADTANIQPGPDGRYSTGDKFVAALLGSIPNMLVNRFVHQDRYPTKSPFIINDSNSPDTEFNSDGQVYSKLCILSLGFNDWRPFHRLCAGASLESPISQNPAMGSLKIPVRKLSMRYSDRLSAKAENPKLNHSIRICSYRDYLRRNLVAYLVKDLDQEERYQRISETGQLTKHELAPEPEEPASAPATTPKTETPAPKLPESFPPSTSTLDHPAPNASQFPVSSGH